MSYGAVRCRFSLSSLCVFICALTLNLAFASVANAVNLLPLATVADESGFGVLNTTTYPELSVNFANGSAFSGSITSRLYTVGAPTITQATFVWDIEITGGFSPVEGANFSATSALDPNLDFSEILAGVTGYVTDTTTNPDGIPVSADVIDNVSIDELKFGWTAIATGDRATLFLTTTGAVAVDEMNVEFQNFGGASAMAYAPTDNTDADIGVPEPATLALVAVAGSTLLRRRRRILEFARATQATGDAR